MGPPSLIAATAKAHQFVVYTVPSALQRAVAYGLDNEEGFYRCLHTSLFPPPGKWYSKTTEQVFVWLLNRVCDANVFHAAARRQLRD